MPEVFDGEGFVQGPCKHPVLFFGSGGFLVICSVCSTQWNLTDKEFTELDLGEADKRVDPNLETPEPEIPTPSNVEIAKIAGEVSAASAILLDVRAQVHGDAYKRVDETWRTVHQLLRDLSFMGES